MSQLTITGKSSSITAISNLFIDQYMPAASGEFVKVYLTLLRCFGDSTLSCSVSAIADHLNHTEKDVLRALNYWEQAGILSLDYDENKKLTGICLLPLEESSPKEALPPETTPEEPVSKPVPSPTLPAAAAAMANALQHPTETPPKAPDFSPEEISSLQDDDEISEILFIVETYLGHQLTPSIINTVLFWCDSLHMSEDLIEHLLTYCISKGHSNITYMDRIARDWHEKGITSVEAAKAEAESYNKVNYVVLKAFGINGRDLAQSERETINRWTKEWGFDETLIEEACRRTIDTTYQPSFPYATKILETWKDNQVKNLDDVAALDASHSKKHTVNVQPAAKTTKQTKRNSFNNFEQRKTNYDAMEQNLFRAQIP